MHYQDKKATRKSPGEIEAVASAVSTLRFVLETVTRSKRNPVNLSVFIETGTTPNAKITVTCSGDTPASQTRCEKIGNDLQATGNFACSSTENGISCTEL